jgi:hypothetical protein
MWFEITTLALLALLSVAVAVPYVLAYRGLSFLNRFLRVSVRMGDKPMSKDLYKF